MEAIKEYKINLAKKRKNRVQGQEARKKKKQNTESIIYPGQDIVLSQKRSKVKANIVNHLDGSLLYEGDNMVAIDLANIPKQKSPRLETSGNASPRVRKQSPNPNRIISIGEEVDITPRELQKKRIIKKSQTPMMNGKKVTYFDRPATKDQISIREKAARKMQKPINSLHSHRDQQKRHFTPVRGVRGVRASSNNQQLPNYYSNQRVQAIASKPRMARPMSKESIHSMASITQSEVSRRLNSKMDNNKKLMMLDSHNFSMLQDPRNAYNNSLYQPEGYSTDHKAELNRYFEFS